MKNAVQNGGWFDPDQQEEMLNLRKESDVKQLKWNSRQKEELEVKLKKEFHNQLRNEIHKWNNEKNSISLRERNWKK
jgi:hypothetical protein